MLTVKNKCIMDGETVYQKGFKSNAEAQLALDEMNKQTEQNDTERKDTNMLEAIITPDSEIAESEKPFEFSKPNLTLVKPDEEEMESITPDEFPPVEEMAAIADEMTEEELQEKTEENKTIIMESEKVYKLMDNEISYELVTIAQFAKMKLNAEVAYQRPIVWKEEQKDLLIDSILKGFNIGTIYVHGNNLLDGKQRNNCIGLTVSGMYQPSTLEEDYADLNGVMIGNWENELQEKFFNAKILLVRLPEIWGEDTAIEQFIRLNRGGRPLTIAQARRGRMIDKLLALNSCINHVVWDMEVKDSKENKVSAYGKIGKPWKEDIIIKLCSSLYGDNNYVAKDLIEWFIKWTLPTHCIKEIQSKLIQFKVIMTTICNADNGQSIIKKVAKKLHVSAILAAMDANTNTRDAGMNLHEFFSRSKENAEVIAYKKLCESGTADPASVKARIVYMRNVIHGIKSK
jgi:hypothetical protein